VIHGCRKSVQREVAQHRTFESLGHHERLGAAVRATCQEPECAPLLVAQLGHSLQDPAPDHRDGGARNRGADRAMIITAVSRQLIPGSWLIWLGPSVVIIVRVLTERVL
jgi:hypothetical protein